MNIQQSLEIEYTIEFSNPYLALAYFKGEFSRYFHEIEDLNTAGKYIALSLLAGDLYIEGVGDFKPLKKLVSILNQSFSNKDNSVIGKITVHFEDSD